VTLAMAITIGWVLFGAELMALGWLVTRKRD
jgi:hypothetical protein